MSTLSLGFDNDEHFAQVSDGCPCCNRREEGRRGNLDRIQGWVKEQKKSHQVGKRADLKKLLSEESALNVFAL